MKIKTYLAAGLAAIGMSLGAFAGTASAQLHYLGFYYDSKEPTQYSSCSALVTSSFQGSNSSNDLWGQNQLMRYTGSGWVGQGTITTYKFNSGKYYNATVGRVVGLTGGAYIYRVRTRMAAYKTDGTLGYSKWDYSAGKNLSCT